MKESLNFPTTITGWEEWKKDPRNWADEADWREWMEENGYGGEVRGDGG